MDHIGHWLRERAEAEARGEIPPYDAKKIEDEMIDGATSWVKDQFSTKEEKEAKAKKKREEIEERERKEREAAGPSLADLFSGFKFGSGKNPFYHLQGGMINPFDKDGNIIDHPLNPFDKDGKRKPRQPMEDDSMFQTPFVPEFDWIENERRTTNPFYHLQGAGDSAREPPPRQIDGDDSDIEEDLSEESTDDERDGEKARELLAKRERKIETWTDMIIEERQRLRAFPAARQPTVEDIIEALDAMREYLRRCPSQQFDRVLNALKRSVNLTLLLRPASTEDELMNVLEQILQMMEDVRRAGLTGREQRREDAAAAEEDDDDAVGAGFLDDFLAPMYSADSGSTDWSGRKKKKTTFDKIADMAGKVGNAASGLVIPAGKFLYDSGKKLVNDPEGLNHLKTILHSDDTKRFLAGGIARKQKGHGQIEDFIGAMDNPYTKDKLTQGAISSVSYLGSKLLDHLLKGGKMPAELVGSGIDDFFNDFFADIAKDGIKKGMEIINKLKGSGWEDDLNAFVSDQLGKLIFGGIAHNPKGHTKRNNNLTKQKPQQKKFCGFKSKVFEHEDYDPAKMHKFRAATCGAKPLTKAGRPAGSKNTQGYTKSGQFTSANRNLGQSRRVRERLLGEGKQLQLMPKEEDLVSKKENPIVEKIIEEPMDDGDIRAYFPKARVMRYAELADYDTIEQLLPKNNSYVFLLYQHRVNDGHFVCLMRYGKTIEFFCSYGSKIDGPLSWTPLPQREALGEGKPYLTMLLRKAPQFDAIHNPVAFQSKTRGIATCGAYCVMRVNQLVNHGQDLHDFIDYMEEIKKETKLSYDEIAANYVAKR
jgi:hypothetical protein